jgi:hypothetical protein
MAGKYEFDIRSGTAIRIALSPSCSNTIVSEDPTRTGG